MSVSGSAGNLLRPPERAGPRWQAGSQTDPHRDEDDAAGEAERQVVGVGRADLLHQLLERVDDAFTLHLDRTRRGGRCQRGGSRGTAAMARSWSWVSSVVTNSHATFSIIHISI